MGYFMLHRRHEWMMNESIITKRHKTSLQKFKSLNFISRKSRNWHKCERDKRTWPKTAILTHKFLFLPFIIPHCVIFRALNLCIFCFLALGLFSTGRLAARLCDQPNLDPSLQIEDWPLKDSHICCGSCIYNFTTFTYSGCHPRYLLTLIYTSMSYNLIVYTAGTSCFL